MKFRFGDLGIFVEETYFSCKKCEEYNPTCYSKHRSCIFFVLRVINLKNKKSVRVLIGEGEAPEDVFPVPCYQSVNGWASPINELPEDIVLQNLNLSPEWKRKELTSFEVETIYRLLLTGNIKQPIALNKYRQWGLLLLQVLYVTGIVDKNTDVGALSVWKPLLMTWLKKGVKKLPMSITIHYFPRSWKAEIRWGKLVIPITKRKLEGLLELECTVGSALGKALYLYFRNLTVKCVEFNGRKTVYKIYPDNIVRGYELYGEHVHPPCTILLHNVSISYLRSRRLGDLLFKKEGESEEDGLNIEIPVDMNQLKKVVAIQGKLSDRFVEGKNAICLYHPEHGVLYLPPGRYKILKVPYVVEGHD